MQLITKCSIKNPQISMKTTLAIQLILVNIFWLTGVPCIASKKEMLNFEFIKRNENHLFNSEHVQLIDKHFINVVYMVTNALTKQIGNLYIILFTNTECNSCTWLWFLLLRADVFFPHVNLITLFAVWYCVLLRFHNYYITWICLCKKKRNTKWANVSRLNLMTP